MGVKLKNIEDERAGLAALQGIRKLETMGN
jgi:hypothetical protein